VINGLKRLSGAKDVSQDDFAKGVGTFLVKFEEFPKTRQAEIRKEIGGYKLDSVSAKLTTKVVSKDAAWFAGDIALANPKDADLLKDVAAKAEETWVLSGALTEDEKGNRLLTLSKAAVAEKK